MENHISKINCAGTGLIALDLVLKGKLDSNPKIYAGGSCGNVLSILSFLDINSFPIARLGDNEATDLIVEDFNRWGIDTRFIEREEKGSTPIIIHRILQPKNNEPKHRFEFRNPNNGKWLPSFRPVLAKKVEDLNHKLPHVDVFYFDRISRSSIELAKAAKKEGSIIFFEPTSNRDKKQFEECLEIADIIKYSDERLKNYKEEYPNIQTTLEIETSGKNGLIYRYKSDVWKHLDALLIDDALDTAGAGDWCSAGIIKSLTKASFKDLRDLREELIVESLKFGQILGALNCLHFGARGLMYEIEKVAFLKMVDNLKENESGKIKFSDPNRVFIDSSTKVKLEEILQCY